MKLSRVLLSLAAVGLVALPFAINDINTSRANAAWDVHATAMLKALPPPARWTPSWTPPAVPGVPSYAFDSCWDLPQPDGTWVTVVGNGDQVLGSGYGIPAVPYIDKNGNRGYRDLRDIKGYGTTPNFDEEIMRAVHMEQQDDPSAHSKLALKYATDPRMWGSWHGQPAVMISPFGQMSWETPATYCHRMRVVLKSAGADVSKMDCMINSVHYPDPLSPLAII